MFRQTPIDQFKSICANAKFYNKKDIPTRTKECTELLKPYAKCMCSLIPMASSFSSELLQFVITKCKQNCKLCQYRNVKDLVKFVANLKYHNIVKIIPLVQIIEIPALLEQILFKNLKEIPKSDIEIISKIQRPEISIAVIEYILVLIDQQNDSSSITLMSNWIKNPAILEDHCALIYRFIIELRTQNRENIFSKEDLQYIFQYKPTYIFVMAFNIAAKTGSTDFINFLIDTLETVHVAHHQMFFLERFPRDVKEKIFEKMENITELVSLRYQRSIRNDYDYWELCIFPTNILESIVVLNGGIEDAIEILMDRNKMKVVYVDEFGNETGVDEGGLTRDFYTTFSQQIQDKFEDVDGYLMPKRGKLLRKDEWQIIGIMIARSIFCENISPSLNLHPILVYLMIHGSENIKIDEFLAAMKPFNIDFLDYMVKLLDMPLYEYQRFMELQDEDPTINSRVYAMNCIAKKYVSAPLRQLTIGFRERMILHDELTQNIRLKNFHTYLRGNVTYNISGANALSMESNLETFYSDKDNLRLEEASENFRLALVEVLNELNSTDIVKLKAFLKFWYGTSSIQNFDNKVATIQFLRNDSLSGVECFESSTCFYKLYVYQKIAMDNYRNHNKLKEKIAKMIDTTLINQNLVETAGLNMQQS